LSIDRDRFLEGLRAENIGISVHFIPVHRHTAYRDRWAPGSFPVADAAYETLLSLPLYPAMTDADADSVIEALRKLAVHYRR
jgi:dTDP-4-amino-4,6-dideoxygalactose transaminase